MIKICKRACVCFSTSLRLNTNEPAFKLFPLFNCLLIIRQLLNFLYPWLFFSVPVLFCKNILQSAHVVKAFLVRKVYGDDK